MVESRRAVFQANVPRVWWFFVPRGVTELTVKAQRVDRYMSQRERWAFFVISPRGRRARALVGQPERTSGENYRQEMVSKVEVPPGAGGRFWALEVGLGDAHNYSNINVALKGVPSFLARSPEEWFNPKTGKLADLTIYKTLPFIQATIGNKGVEKRIRDRWPDLKHWTPVPSQGDPDNVQVLGDATVKLWNPEGRKLGFRINTYLPRREGGKLPSGAHRYQKPR